MEISRNKYLIKNTLLFTLGNLGSKLIVFFLIPLYTNTLSTAQYGTIDLVSTVSTVAVPIFTINICESVMRFALDKNADKEQILMVKIGTATVLIFTNNSNWYIYFAAWVFTRISNPPNMQYI